MISEKASEYFQMLKGSFSVGTKRAEEDGRDNDRFRYEAAIHAAACKDLEEYVNYLEQMCAMLKLSNQEFSE